MSIEHWDRPWSQQFAQSSAPYIFSQEWRDHLNRRQAAMTDVSTDGLVERHTSECQDCGFKFIPIHKYRSTIAALERSNAEKDDLLNRIAAAVQQYREAPFRSADWLANETMAAFDDKLATLPPRKALSHSSETGCD